jgi:hypothetical protein
LIVGIRLLTLALDRSGPDLLRAFALSCSRAVLDPRAKRNRATAKARQRRSSISNGRTAERREDVTFKSDNAVSGSV